MRRHLPWLMLPLAFAAGWTTLRPEASRMADAMPLYLYGGAWLKGLNPLEAENLRTVYTDRGMDTKAALWSTLYPATAGPVMAPFSLLSWPSFNDAWTAVMLASCLLVGALVPAGWRGRALGLGLMLAWSPTAETMRLGQVNAVLAALIAAAFALSRHNRDLGAGLLLGVGAALKLVPAIIAVPLVSGKRWKVAVGGLLAGGLALALASRVVAVPEIIEGIRATARFQTMVAPDWLRRPELPWGVRGLAQLRHNGLGGLSLLLALGATLWRPSPGVLAGGMALLAAWLGTDASVFHLLYAPLFAPAWIWVATWALEEDAPRWTWGLSAPLAALGLWLPRTVFGAQDHTVACMVLGWICWVGAFARLCQELGRAAERGLLAPVIERFTLPSLGLGGFAGALALGLLGRVKPADPLPPGATLQPDGRIQWEGVGFQSEEIAAPGERFAKQGAPALPGEQAERAWPDMPPTGSLPKGRKAAFDEHLRSAEQGLLMLAGRTEDPALAEEARSLAAAVPPLPLKEATFGELSRFLAREEVLLRRLEAEGVETRPLRPQLDVLLAPAE